MSKAIKNTRPTIALIGNPNSGKSSLFNALTGLHQKVGNFPSTTVEKKTGQTLLADTEADIIDLPGTYSLYPKKEDEWVVYRYLMSGKEPLDAVVLTIDAMNIRRNLLFCSQVIELKIPAIIALTMVDITKRRQIQINIPELERRMGVPIIVINPRRNKGTEELKKLISKTLAQEKKIIHKKKPFIEHTEYAGKLICECKHLFPADTSNYRILHYAVFPEHITDTGLKNKLNVILQKIGFNKTTLQAAEITRRYQKINEIARHTISEINPKQQKLFTDKLDNVLLHKYWGYGILVLTLFLLFQSIFWIAQYPMNLLSEFFEQMETGFIGILPNYIFTPAISNTFIAKLLLSGISTTVVFVPQIMILTAIITFLEDSGYMARISFLSDNMMRKFGLNGKSLMPLISGMACAVPAVMATRNIENKKERLLTIFTVPFITCSARLPIFVMLTSITIPEIYYFNFISLQGLVMMILYIMGFVLAFSVSLVFRFFIKTKERSIFILELPLYKTPRLKNIGLEVLRKMRIFLIDVGKVIIIISVFLTLLFSLVPKSESVPILQAYNESVAVDPDHRESYELKKNADLLNHSYAAEVGRFIEPVVTPLGYNWQIGIAVLASFAAREVFIGTLATVYSFEEDKFENKQFLRSRLNGITNAKGEKIFTTATTFSLIVFYMLAMQCMSTMAMVKRETGSWLFTLSQFTFMGIIAYIFAFLTHFILQ